MYLLASPKCFFSLSFSPSSESRVTVIRTYRLLLFTFTCRSRLVLEIFTLSLFPSPILTSASSPLHFVLLSILLFHLDSLFSSSSRASRSSPERRRWRARRRLFLVAGPRSRGYNRAPGPWLFLGRRLVSFTCKMFFITFKKCCPCLTKV